MDLTKTLLWSLVLFVSCVQGQEIPERFKKLFFDSFAARYHADPIVKRLLAGETYAGVSDQCTKDMMVLLTAAGSPGAYQWAAMYLNADARDTTPQIGALLGNAVAEGSYDLCLGVKATGVPVYANTTNPATYVGMHNFSMHYCTARWSTPSNKVGTAEGWCVPETCKRDDVVGMMSDRPPPTIKTAYCGTKPPIEKNAGAIVALTIVSIFLALVIIATVFDGIMTKLKEMRAVNAESTPKALESGQSNEAYAEVETTLNGDVKQANGDVAHPVKGITESKPGPAIEDKPGALHRALVSFSLLRTLPAVLQSGGSRSTYGCMNGLRVIAMTWILLGHSWVLDTHVLTDPGNMLVANYWSQFDGNSRFGHQLINNMNLSVEIFFFLGAALVTMSFMKTLKRLENVGAGGRVKEMLLYVFHRYWRLTPLFAALIMIWGNLWQYLGSGPVFPEHHASADNCKSIWWANLLYIQNFYKGNGECMGWTWYLANDFQFFLTVPVFAVVLYVKPVAGYILLFLGWAGSTTARAVLFSKGLDGYWDIYVKPWCRFGPYAQGILMGYIIYKTKCKVKMNKFMVFLGWLVAFALGMLVVFGTYENGKWSRDVGIAYNTLKRDAFTLGIAWTTFACIAGYGGLINTFLAWNFFTPVSKLTYCSYLIHPMIHFISLASRQKLLFVQDITMVYQYLGNLVLTLICSLGLTVVFEVPFLALEKVILPSHKK